MNQNYTEQIIRIEKNVLTEINQHVERAGTVAKLSKLVYGNRNTLNSILFRNSKSDSTRVVKLIETLKRIEAKL